MPPLDLGLGLDLDLGLDVDFKVGPDLGDGQGLDMDFPPRRRRASRDLRAQRSRTLEHTRRPLDWV